MSEVCTDHLSNSLIFFDYKNYLLITNHISGQQYVYWKKQQKLQTISIDSTVIRDIYVGYLHNPAQYEEYKLKAAKSANYRPKIKSTCAYDENTVLGCLVTIRRDTTITGKDTVVNFIPMPSVVEIREGKPITVSFVNEKLPIPHHCFNTGILSYKNKVYLTLCPDIEGDIDYNGLHDLARLKKQQSIYSVDKIMPTVINDYLVTNKVFDNYNRIYFDNGYSLMSLSNYIFNIETGEKIPMPIADSVFRSLHIDPKTFAIGYYVSDFKYNATERKYYIRYTLGENDYAASFKAGANSLEDNLLMYSYNSEFGKNIKAACLSWDGKKIVYSMKGEDCFHYATPLQLKEIAKQFKIGN